MSCNRVSANFGCLRALDLADAGAGASTHLEAQEAERGSAVRLAAVGEDPLALWQGEQQRAQLRAAQHRVGEPGARLSTYDHICNAVNQHLCAFEGYRTRCRRPPVATSHRLHTRVLTAGSGLRKSPAPARMQSQYSAVSKRKPAPARSARRLWL